VQSTADTRSLIEAPMPGLVRGVFVEVGQNVARGDRLMVLEAMKMEHSLQANRDAMVAQVLVVSGQQVMAGDPLVQFGDEDTEA
jgi:3-methylcrotonyl-CoA carboxylase alpha subunit